MLITIAVVQFAITPLASEANLERAEHFIQKAVAQQADLIVFPEDFLLGPLTTHTELADFSGYYVKYFQRLAQKYAIDIVPGTIIEGEESGLYNTAYYIDRSGEILGRYRKVNLWLPERSYIEPGEHAIVCATRFGKIGLAICWDLAFPELFRALLLEGAQLVLCPSYWCFEDAGIGVRHNPESEVLFVDALCTVRAFEQEIILVYANAAGKVGADTLIGHSQITVPFRGPLQLCTHANEAMFVQTVDTAILTDAETAYEIRQDLQKGLSLKTHRVD